MSQIWLLGCTIPFCSGVFQGVAGIITQDSLGCTAEVVHSSDHGLFPDFAALRDILPAPCQALFPNPMVHLVVRFHHALLSPRDVCSSGCCVRCGESSYSSVCGSGMG